MGLEAGRPPLRAVRDDEASRTAQLPLDAINAIGATIFSGLAKKNLGFAVDHASRAGREDAAAAFENALAMIKQGEEALK